MVIVDVDKKRTLAETLEFSHAQVVEHTMDIVDGDYPDTANSDFVVVTAGAHMKPGQTRMDLLGINSKIFEQIIPQIAKYSPEATLIIATNPLDVMTYQAWKYSSFPKERVIGSGTLLDSSRFRYNLSKYLKTKAANIEAFVLGEHGDSQVPIFSNIMVEGLDLESYCKKAQINFSKEQQMQAAADAKNAAYQIVEGKGATYYSIASCLLAILKAIWLDEGTVFPVSTLLEGQYGIDGTYISVPVILNESGVQDIVEFDLNPDELTKLQASANIIKNLL